MRSRVIGIIAFLVAAVWSFDAVAQRYPERRIIRSANKDYKKEAYSDAEVKYMRAMGTTPTSVEARFNMSDALYRQERYEEATNMLAPLTADSLPEQLRQQSHYNQGNANFKQRKLQEALESYKNALRLNPKDTSAKFNLAYTQKLLENQKNQNNQNKDNKDNKDNKNNQNQNQNQQPQNKPEDQNKDKQDKQNQQPQPHQLSRQEAEQMLQAMQQSEDNTREKVKAEKAKAQASSIKNW